MRSVEITFVGMLTSFISLLVNVALNYVLIFGKLGLPHGKRMDALLDDPLVVRKSFPTFWKVWERLL